MHPEFIYMASVSGYLAEKHGISIENIMDIVQTMGSTTFTGDVDDYECALIYTGTYRDISTAGIATDIGNWCTATMVRDVFIVMRNARINASKIETEINRIKLQIPKLTDEQLQGIAHKSKTDMSSVKATIKFLIGDDVT